MAYRNKGLMMNTSNGTKIRIGSLINEICLLKGFGVTIAGRAKYAIHSNTPYYYQNKYTGEYVEIKNNTININGTIYKRWFKIFNNNNNNNSNNKNNNNNKRKNNRNNVNY